MKENEFRASFPLGKFLFRCNNCGGCCRNTNAVQLTMKDYHKIENLGEDRTKFLAASPKTMSYPHEAFPFVIKESEDCIFLKDKLCQIWLDKPLRCNLYPLIMGIDLKRRILINLERCPAILEKDGIKIDEKFVGDAFKTITENLRLEKYFSWWSRVIQGKEEIFFNRKKTLLKILETVASDDISEIAPNLGFYERLDSLWRSSFLRDLQGFVQGTGMSIEDLDLIEDSLVQGLVDYIQAIKGNFYDMRIKGQLARSSKIKIKNPFNPYDDQTLIEGDVKEINKVRLSSDALHEVYKYLVEILERDGYLGALASDIEIGFYLRLLRKVVYNLETLTRAYAFHDGREDAVERDVIMASVVVDPNLVGYARKIA